jgi:hypothetical protein
MNVTQVTDRGGPPTSSATRRFAVVAVTMMAAAGAGLLVHAAVAGARFEMIVAALGLGAGAALVGVLVLTPGGRLSIVPDDDDA